MPRPTRWRARFQRRSLVSANEFQHRVGQDVNSVDQLSSIVILGLAVAGGIAAVVLDLLLIG
ncbi:hypothetical protein B2G69_20765 [Methylorubrum zatmanii]|nr:hypothetical protein B2G69_20765 [Methylorubrum zatmanii]